MNRIFTKLLMIGLLFVFGLLFGLQSKENPALDAEDARETFIDPKKYISRIENGQMVFVPVHSNSQAEKKDKYRDDKVNQESKDEASNKTDEGPKMDKRGSLDQIGQTIGNKFSEFTRITLEKSFSIFIND